MAESEEIVSLLDKKTVCVITGPTKGLGKSIALQLAKTLPKGSLFILLARSEDLLESVSLQIKGNDGVGSVWSCFDQGNAEGESNGQMFKECLQKIGASQTQFDQALLINNAGTLKPLQFARNLDQLHQSCDFFKINLSGCVTLTASFLQVFKDVKLRTVINISSLAAISPMKSWLLYCMAKAARDMMMKVIAAEEENIRTLNYAPGPLQTEMYQVAASDTKDAELQKWFKDQGEGNKLVECDDSAKKLVNILKKNLFENAAHIDYFDDI